MRNLMQGEVKSFTDEKEFFSFINKVRDDQEWVYVYTKGIGFVPLPENPICIPVIRNDLGFPADVSNEVIAEEMIGTKLALDLRKTDASKFGVRPVAATAYRGVFQRAGAECPVMTSLKETAQREEIPTELRAECLAKFSSYAKGMSLLLLGDEEVLADLSENYVVLPIPEVMATVSKTLKQKYELVEFKDGNVCHETTYAEYTITDTELEENIRRVFDEYLHITPNDEDQPAIGVITSDVGYSGVNIHPILIRKGGLRQTLGLPVKLEHVGNASITKVIENIGLALDGFGEFEDYIKDLTEITIKRPSSCLVNIGKKFKLADKALMLVAAEVDEEYPLSCDATTIYAKLFEVLDLMDDISDLRRMQLCELISGLCFSEGGRLIGRYDYPSRK